MIVVYRSLREDVNESRFSLCSADNWRNLYREVTAVSSLQHTSREINERPEAEAKSSNWDGRIT